MRSSLPLRVLEEDGAFSVPLEPPISEAEASGTAQVFASLGDPIRLRLYSLIASRPRGVCACEVVEPIGRSQPTVSHHLKVLYEAGLVNRERRGSWIWYTAEPNRLAQALTTANSGRE